MCWSPHVRHRATYRRCKKTAEKYLLVACTDLYTHYLLGDRDLAAFKAFVPAGLTAT